VLIESTFAQSNSNNSSFTHQRTAGNSFAKVSLTLLRFGLLSLEKRAIPHCPATITASNDMNVPNSGIATGKANVHDVPITKQMLPALQVSTCSQHQEGLYKTKYVLK
jgi:hypothetical protein